MESVQRLVGEALALPSPADRQRFLEETCGTDLALLQEARLWLAEMMAKALPETCDDSQSATPATGDEPAAGSVSSSVAGEDGVEIGELLADKYRIRERVGAGGMGAVYIADQIAPVQRRVAVKLIKAGMDSAQVLNRFALERQALALMDHPNIARIYDGGLNRLGRPFFVMELVRGLPLTKYCDQEKLDVRGRLALLIPVCQAVQHAHQKGIIHRDLKPSNILVGLVDGKPTPKIIDFGVAKALHQGIVDESVYTALNMIVGTLEYMAPEQADFSSIDIDTRADIYSLGVVLYELLCGTLPFTRKELRGGLEEFIRVIREVEPKRPSTRTTTLKDAETIAARRLSAPQALNRQLRGDLDWVVMKCLAKERDRRYASAQGLAADLDRYLRDEPVLAAPPSARYRIGKFVRRHRGKVIAASLGLVLVAGAAVVSTVGWIRAVRAERLAREENAIHQALVGFIQQDLFNAADPTERARLGLPADADVKLRTLVERAGQRLQDGRFQDQPLVEAALQLTLAKAYLALGLLDNALRHAQRADQIRTAHLGAEHLDRLDSLFLVGRIHYSLRESGKAKEPLEKVLAGRSAAWGDEHPSVLEVRFFLAGLCLQNNQLVEAEAAFSQLALQRERALGAAHEDTLRTRLRLADVHSLRQKLPQAEAELRTILQQARQGLGEGHPVTLAAMNSLANVLGASGGGEEAENLNVRLVELAETTYGPKHPLHCVFMNNLATGYIGKGELAKARAILEEIEPEFLKIGETHRLTLVMRSNLAYVLASLGDYKQALVRYELLLPQFLERFGEQRSNTWNLLSHMADVYLEDRQPEKAEATLRLLLKCHRQRRPWDPPAVAGTASRLADILANMRQHGKAEAVLIEVIGELPACEARKEMEAKLRTIRQKNSS